MEEQAIRFTAAGGRRIAWTSSGSGPPLVFSGWWMSHLELNWRDPRFRAYVEALGRHRTVIRYDAPGTGLSAADPAPDADLDDEATVLGAVVEAAASAGIAAGDAPVDLFAGSSGAPIAVAFAAAHPERVRRLIVYGGYTSGSGIADERSRKAIVALVREHWGLGSRALADVFMPGATPAEREAFVEFQRVAASADRAARSLEAVYRFDAADRLSHVAPGALVQHRRDDRAIPFALGRDLAAGLHGATFVALDGSDHFPWLGDTDQVLAGAFDALGIGVRPDRVSSRGGEAKPSERSGGADDLTEREAEVLALIAAGLTDREIAERLVLSRHTVHRHVANVRTKLGLSTRAAAVAEAGRRGLL